MKTFQTTFLSLLIASIASARSIASSRAQDLIRVNIVNGIDATAKFCAKPTDPGLGNGSDLQMWVLFTLTAYITANDDMYIDKYATTLP